MTENHTKLVKKCFEGLAQRWDDIYCKVEKVNDLVQIERKNFAITFLKKYTETGSSVLDAGCGTGVVSMEAVRSGFSVKGVDIAGEMIEHCRQNLQKSNVRKNECEFVCGDVSDCHFKDGHFAAILALGFLEYHKDEGAILRELNRILRSGGVLIVSGPIRYSISNCFRFAYILKSIYLCLKKMIGKKVVESEDISINEYSLRRFTNLLVTTGYEVIDCKRHGYANFILLRELIGFKGELFLYKLFTGLARILPIDRFANNIIVVARKV